MTLEAVVADERELLREAARRILENDKDLAEQLDKLRGLASHVELKPALEGVQERVGALEVLGPDSQLALETIVNRVGRPVLEVANDDYLVEGPEAAIWEARLGNATVRSALRQVIPSVGRIEVDNHPDLTWVGTGWLIADDVVVTNRHVASEFAALSVTPAGRTFVFKRGWPDRTTRMAARVDFRRELHNNSPRAFVVREVLHIEHDDGPDFAFLRVERTGPSGGLSPSLRTAGAAAQAQQYVAAVGYPAADSRIPEQDLMSRLFGDKYNVKRLAPGQVMRLADELVMHDCSTLGGNSGSPIVDLATGDVLGLHFSGVFLRENRGVPIRYVTDRLQKVLNPLRPTDDGLGETRPTATPAPGPQPAPTAEPLLQSPSDRRTLSWTIPLQITVSVGVTAAVGATAPGGPPAPGASEPQPAAAVSAGIEGAVNEARALLRGRSDVLTVRDGYQFRNGWITPDPAVVVVLKDRGPATPQELGLPSKVLGFPVEVRVAGPWDFAEAEGRLEALEGLPHTTYQKPAGFELEEVNEKMTVICHVSPDAGWPTLQEFLEGTKNRLTAGVYNFTAPHIIDGVSNAMADVPGILSLVMQANEALTGPAKKNDRPEKETVARYNKELGGDRFHFAWSSVGKDHQFATAYHIKVAVRDGKAFWLSSGNWQSSNQPNHEIAVGEASWDLLMQHNRDWHIVIENAKLAQQFEKYLLYDLKNAEADATTELPAAEQAYFLVDEAVEERVPAGIPTYFAPLKVNRKVQVQPLLTPDNYQEHVLALIETAERRLLFQNQSLSLLGFDKNGEDKNDERFAALADALLAKHKAGVDVRIIMRGEFAPVGPLEQLQKRGFDMGKVRLQNRCHTKGIIVDGARVLIGSHNWTNQGTLVNRDASLIFEDKEIAAYFEDIFWFDWKHLTRQSVGGRRARPAGGDEEAPAGTRRVSWQEIVNGD
jgi:S1-C subfamily serine protease